MIVCISTKSDATMLYFLRYLSEMKIAAHWVIWENIFRGDDVDTLFQILDCASGCYVREPSVSTLSQHIAIRGIYSIIQNTGIPSILPSFASSNYSKWLHYLVIRSNPTRTCRSIKIPETSFEIETSESSKFICKSISNIPSRVTNSSDKLNFYNGTPFQISPHIRQDKISGLNVRVHIVGSSVVALYLFHDDVIDYRDSNFHAEQAGLPRGIINDMLEFMSKESATFAGFDFIFDGVNYWLLEINPMPGYHSFEIAMHCNERPISAQLTAFLLCEV